MQSGEAHKDYIEKGDLQSMMERLEDRWKNR